VRVADVEEIEVPKLYEPVPECFEIMHYVFDNHMHQ
jgi:hypothetical protein